MFGRSFADRGSNRRRVKAGGTHCGFDGSDQLDGTAGVICAKQIDVLKISQPLACPKVEVDNRRIVKANRYEPSEARSALSEFLYGKGEFLVDVGLLFLVTRLREIPQLCSAKFLTCERSSL
jgi:hypothetical protein